MAEILEDRQAGRGVATEDPSKLMSFGRVGGALGVASALGELDRTQAVEAAVLGDFTLYSSVASISTGLEVRSRKVIVAFGGAEHQGPDGGGIVALIAERAT